MSYCEVCRSFLSAQEYAVCSRGCARLQTYQALVKLGGRTNKGPHDSTRAATNNPRVPQNLVARRPLPQPPVVSNNPRTVTARVRPLPPLPVQPVGTSAQPPLSNGSMQPCIDYKANRHTQIRLDQWNFLATQNQAHHRGYAQAFYPACMPPASSINTAPTIHGYPDYYAPRK